MILPEWGRFRFHPQDQTKALHWFQQENTLAIPFTARLSAPPHVLIRQVEGESVMLNLQNERYFGLDEVGTRM